MIFADQDFYDECLKNFEPTASATAYGQRPKFIRAEHSATAEGENCAYGPTLGIFDLDVIPLALSFSNQFKGLT